VYFLKFRLPNESGQLDGRPHIMSAFGAGIFLLVVVGDNRSGSAQYCKEKFGSANSGVQSSCNCHCSCCICVDGAAAAAAERGMLVAGGRLQSLSGSD